MIHDDWNDDYGAEFSLPKMAPAMESIHELLDLIIEKALRAAMKELYVIAQYARDHCSEDYNKNIENIRVHDTKNQNSNQIY